MTTTVRRSIVLGALSGIRSTAAFAALAGSDGAGTDRPLGSRLLSAGLKGGLALESVADKIGVLPPRTDPLPLAGRALAGGIAAAVAARRAGSRFVPGALLGGLTAVGTAWAVTSFRGRLRRSGVPDLLPALLEDLAVAALGASTRREMQEATASDSRSPRGRPDFL